MKRRITILLICLLTILAVNNVVAQYSPNKVNYQAVLRDATGAIVPNVTVTVKVKINQTSASGTLVYEEDHSVTTTAQGVINLVIGNGTPVSGTFSAIKWYDTDYYVTVLVNGTEISQTAFRSVPYAQSVKGISVNPANGNVGIGTGTTDPGAKLHVEGSFRLVDGTQAADKLLKSDASGNASWVTVAGNTPAVTAVYPETASSDWTDGLPLYTGTTLTLPPGKWSIQVATLISTPTDNSECWVRSTFTDGPLISSSTPDIVGANLASGYKAHHPAWGMINGTIIIHNTSGSNKTYYYWGQNSNAWGGDSFRLYNFGRGVALEDQIIAYPMN